MQQKLAPFGRFSVVREKKKTFEATSELPAFETTPGILSLCTLCLSDFSINLIQYFLRNAFTVMLFRNLNA